MKNFDSKGRCSQCPRCEDTSLEYFESHDCCFSCGYSTENSIFEEEDFSIPPWVFRAIEENPGDFIDCGGARESEAEKYEMEELWQRQVC